MSKKANSTAKKAGSTTDLAENMIALNCDFEVFNDTIQKIAMSMEMDGGFDEVIPLIKVIDGPLNEDSDFEGEFADSFGDRAGGSFFLYSKKNNVIAINQFIRDSLFNYTNIALSSLTEALIGMTDSDFRYRVFIEGPRCLVWASYRVEDGHAYHIATDFDFLWEDRNTHPGLRQLAEAEGMIANDDGDYDDEEWEELIYNKLRDYLYDDMYLFAPTFYWKGWKTNGESDDERYEGLAHSLWSPLVIEK